MSTLAELPLHRDAVVRTVRVAAELAQWLAAVGLEPGVRVRVLRRAAFGGPLHVRTGEGELAVDATLAGTVEVSDPTSADEP